MLAVPESGDTLEQLFDFLGSSSLGFNIAEFQPHLPSKTRLYPGPGDRRYSSNCGRTERYQKLPYVGIAGRMAPTLVTPTPRFLRLS